MFAKNERYPVTMPNLSAFAGSIEPLWFHHGSRAGRSCLRFGVSAQSAPSTDQLFLFCSPIGQQCIFIDCNLTRIRHILAVDFINLTASEIQHYCRKKFDDLVTTASTRFTAITELTNSGIPTKQPSVYQQYRDHHDRFNKACKTILYAFSTASSDCVQLIR